jgi:glutamate racemase
VTPPLLSSPCIGVFDSGSGGLSVLAALRRRLPDSPLLYIGDVAFAPYGDRTPDDVVDRCQHIVARLVERGATTIVVACNTATVLGIQAMRNQWPAVEFIGVEPGVKPAVAATRNGRIAVMTTPATAESARLLHLIDTFASGVHVCVVPCPGLASAIERDAEDFIALHALLADPCAMIREYGADTVVLGCTHYPFAAHAIQRLIGDDIRLIDTATAVAERVAAVCSGRMPMRGGLRMLSTGATAEMATLLRRCREFDRIEIEFLSTPTRHSGD